MRMSITVAGQTVSQRLALRKMSRCQTNDKFRGRRHCISIQPVERRPPYGAFIETIAAENRVSIEISAPKIV